MTNNRKKIYDVLARVMAPDDVERVKDLMVRDLLAHVSPDFVYQAMEEYGASVRRETLVGLTGVFEKLCPEVIPIILTAHKKYHEDIAARDESFERLMALLRGPT